MKSYRIRLKGLSGLCMSKITDGEREKLIYGSKTVKKNHKQTKDETKDLRSIADERAYKTTDGYYYIPDNWIRGAFKNTASDYKSTNSSRKSLKSSAPGIFRIVDRCIVLKDVDNKPLTTYEVDIQDCVNHKAGLVIAIKPRFDIWYCDFDVEIEDDLISPNLVHEILNDAGKRVGIGSFRISQGGPFGRFAVIGFDENV